MDAPNDALCSGTAGKVGIQRLLGILSLFRRCLQMIIPVNTGDLEDTVYVFDVSCHFGPIEVTFGPDFFSTEDLLSYCIWRKKNYFYINIDITQLPRKECDISWQR